MSGKEVFLIGPGYIGREVLDRLLAEDYEVTVLARSSESASTLEASGAKIRMGTLDDAEAITDQTCLSDVVIHTAGADHLPSVQAVLVGVETRAADGKSTIYIHTSGAGLFDDDSKGNFKSDIVYEDDKPEMIDALSDSAPHREMDLAIIRARKELKREAKLVIILPPTIYGLNPKYGRMSIQMPTLTRFGLKHGYGGHVGKGEGLWGNIHVFDLARAYIAILHWMENASPEEVMENPYFFCENGTESSWREKAGLIGNALHAAGKAASPETRTIPEKNYVDVFGRFTESAIGTNARVRANRLRAMGWSPQEKGLYESLVEDELPVILQETTEFKGYVL